MSSSIFRELIRRSRRISRDQFATDFGGIDGDVVLMLDSEEAQKAQQEAREIMESAQTLPSGQPRLRQVEFGLFSTASELERGEVASVDGKFALPMQIYSAGQALCVGVGSLSHRRGFEDSLHYWSSRALLSEARDTDDFIARQERGLFGISQTAYLRYFEIRHGLEILEPYVLFDGTLVYEWLVATQEGVSLYQDLLASGKRCIGVMKNIKANIVFSTFARALQTGEIYIIETLFDHLHGSNVPNRNPGEGGGRYALPDFERNIAPHIYRGIFKPAKKAFGFEVHEDHLEDMLRILAADCQMNMIGHEIPYLLNRVDEAVGRNFNNRMLQNRIISRMATQSEDLFFREQDERDFR